MKFISTEKAENLDKIRKRILNKVSNSDKKVLALLPIPKLDLGCRNLVSVAHYIQEIFYLDVRGNLLDI